MSNVDIDNLITSNENIIILTSLRGLDSFSPSSRKKSGGRMVAGIIFTCKASLVTKNLLRAREAGRGTRGGGRCRGSQGGHN